MRLAIAVFATHSPVTPRKDRNLMNHLYGGVALVALVLTACSSGGNPEDTDQDPVALDQLPLLFANELCDAIAPCCAAGQVAYDATTCKNTASEVYGLFVNTSAGTNTKYDPKAARACLTQLKSVLASCGTLVPGAGGLACDDIFSGTLPPAGSAPTFGRCSGQGVCGSTARPETCMGDFHSVPGG